MGVVPVTAGTVCRGIWIRFVQLPEEGGIILAWRPYSEAAHMAEADR